MISPEIQIQLEEIGQKIRKVREEKGLTQEQLEKACGMEEADICKLEAGNMNASLQTMVGVAEALGIRLAALFPS